MKLARIQPLSNEFKCMVLDEFLAATTFEQFEQAFTRIRGESTFKKMPRYAREGVTQYRQGIVDVISKLKGRPVSVSMRTGRRRRRKSREGVPQNIRVLQPGPWHRHPNGGGWVSNTARVDRTAFVSKGCVVLNNAQVLGNAKLLGQVQVADRAVVRDHAVLRGTAKLHDDAVLQDEAVVHGNADVGDHIRLGGTIKIGGGTVLRGDLTLGLVAMPGQPSNESHSPPIQATN